MCGNSRSQAKERREWQLQVVRQRLENKHTKKARVERTRLLGTLHPGVHHLKINLTVYSLSTIELLSSLNHEQYDIPHENPNIFDKVMSFGSLERYLGSTAGYDLTVHGRPKILQIFVALYFDAESFWSSNPV